MNRALALLVIGLVFGGGIGFVIAAANGVTLDGHDHATDHGQMDHSAHGAASGHDHSDLVEATGEAPTLMAHVMPDPVSGWNLRLMVENFTFNPGAAGADHVDGEGHAHVYVNNVKIARLYGEWMHIGTLPPGDVEIRVTLNSNDHRTLAVAGASIEAVVTLVNGG